MGTAVYGFTDSGKKVKIAEGGSSGDSQDTSTSKCLFGFTDSGEKVCIGRIAVSGRGGSNYVGGTIFYINSSGDGTYTFYNENGNEVDAPSVGDDCTGWTYDVSGATVDKYYVSDLSNTTYIRRIYDDTYYIVWSTEEEDLSEYSSEIEITTRATTNLCGETNSNFIKNNRYTSVYYPKVLGGSENFISIWEIRDEANAAQVNGCDDWYVPSQYELKLLRLSYGEQMDTEAYTNWHNAVKYDSNTTSAVRCSSCYNSKLSVVWRVKTDNPSDTSIATTKYLQNTAVACVLIRSF